MAFSSRNRVIRLAALPLAVLSCALAGCASAGPATEESTSIDISPETASAPPPPPEVLEYLEDLARSESTVTWEFTREESRFVDLGDHELPEMWERQREARTRYLEATNFALVGRWAEAERACREALRLSPGSATIAAALARALVEQGRLRDAISLLEETRQSYPGDAVTLKLLALTLGRAGEQEKAVEIWRELTKLQPRNDGHLVGLAAALVSEQDVEGALDVLRQLRDRGPDARRFGMDEIQSLLFLAELAQQTANDTQLAIDWYEKIITARPYSPYPYIRLGQLHQLNHDRDSALDVYRSGLLLDPADEMVNRAIFDVFGEDELDDYLAWWDDFAQDFPHNSELQLAHVKLLQTSGFWDEARETLEDLVESRPDSFEAQPELGVALRNEQEDEEAVKHLLRAIDLNPESEVAAVNLFGSLIRLGRHDEARALIESAFPPAERPSRLVLLARDFASHSRYTEAEETFLEAISLAPDNPTFRNDYMDHLARNGEDEKGLEVALQAIEDFGLAADTPVNYYWIERFSDSITDDNRDQVVDVLTRAVEREPTPATLRTLALFHLDHADNALVPALLDRAWDSSEDAANRIAVIRLQLRLGALDVAADLLTQAMDHAPDIVDFKLWDGVRHDLAGDRAEAETIWTPVFEERANLPSSARTVGDLAVDDHLDTGLSMALSIIRTRGVLVETGPSQAAVRSNGRVVGSTSSEISLIQLILPFDDVIDDRFDEVYNTLHGAMGDEPTAEDWNQLGQLSALHGHPERAREAFLAAWHANPEDIHWTEQLTLICSDLELYDVAEEFLNEALELNPESDEILYQLGFIHDAAGRTDKAEEMFRRAVAVNPENYMALNHLGYMFTVEDYNLEEALDLTLRAVELSDRDMLANPDNLPNGNGFIVDSLGWAHYKLGNWDEAVHWLGEAIRRAESQSQQAMFDGVFYDHYGDALMKDGRGEEALQAWLQALDRYQRRGMTDELLEVGDKILAEQPERRDIVNLVERVRTRLGAEPVID